MAGQVESAATTVNPVQWILEDEGQPETEAAADQLAVEDQPVTVSVVPAEEGSQDQGCQMVCFQTKNPNLGKFWRVLQWRTKGQNQNKNQREGNTPPPPIAILLVLRKPKN
jgi:hypothetical protein